MSESFEARCEVLKVDKRLGLVIGFGLECRKRDDAGALVPILDTQGDYIPERTMVESTLDFMTTDRISGEMHEVKLEGERYGTVVFGFPWTEDIAKAFGYEAHRTGFMLAVRPDPEVLEKFDSGEYTGFSLGGKRLEEKPLEEVS